MKRNRMALAALLGAFSAVAGVAQTNVYSINASSVITTQALPDFHEVYQILTTNLEGVSPAELNAAAVRGLEYQLGSRVHVVGANDASISNAAALADERVFDHSFGYFRLANVSSNLPDAFHSAFKQMTETNGAKIKGLVLDLRFAEGTDYAAAAKLADAFLNSTHALLDWKAGSANATLKPDPITIPVAILVNGETAGAAEALAAVLRDTDVGLILGSTTAGRANVFKEIPLREGGKLRVAVAQVSFGAGKTMPQGVAPDIAIHVSQDDERAYLQNPFKTLHPPETANNDANSRIAFDQPRLNEVELIREHSSGEDQAANTIREAPPSSDSIQTVADPVLARALDLLKGLAVVQPNRPG